MPTSFARSISDGRSVTVATIEEGVARLAREWEAIRAARFYLMLLDPTETEEGLAEVADAAERLSRLDSSRNYVRGVLSIDPLWPGLEFGRIEAYLEGRPLLAELTREILASRDAAILVRDAFGAACLGVGYDEADAMVLVATLVESGAWVRLVDTVDLEIDTEPTWREIEDIFRPFQAATSLVAEWRSRLQAAAPSMPNDPAVSASNRRERPADVIPDTGKGAQPYPGPLEQRFTHRLSPQLSELIDAGAHFGHKKSLWNPKMKAYIFGVREGIHIIDLSQTLRLLDKALAYVSDIAANDGNVLFVGTKKVAQPLVCSAAGMTGQHYVNYRWLGGTLTNWETIKRSICKLEALEAMLADQVGARKKHEIRTLERKRDKLEISVGGIRQMRKLPDLLFVVDAGREHLAIREAQRLDIPVVALVDSNSSPDGIAFPIPCNDDSRRAVALVCEAMVAAIDRGRLRGRSGVFWSMGSLLSPNL